MNSPDLNLRCENPISGLYEFCHKYKLRAPVFTYSGEGPFSAQVEFFGLSGNGIGYNQKEAKRKAAAQLLSELMKEEHSSRLESYRRPTTVLIPEISVYVFGTNYVGMLQEYCVKNGLPLAQYQFDRKGRGFNALCTVGPEQASGYGDSKKVQAKQSSSYLMLLKLTKNVHLTPEKIVSSGITDENSSTEPARPLNIENKDYVKMDQAAIDPGAIASSSVPTNEMSSTQQPDQPTVKNEDTSLAHLSNDSEPENIPADMRPMDKVDNASSFKEEFDLQKAKELISGAANELSSIQQPDQPTVKSEDTSLVHLSNDSEPGNIHVDNASSCEEKAELLKVKEQKSSDTSAAFSNLTLSDLNSSTILTTSDPTNITAPLLSDFDPAETNGVHRLKEFCEVWGLSKPTYEFVSASDDTYTYICRVGEFKAEGEGPCMKLAVNLASLSLLQILGELVHTPTGLKSLFCGTLSHEQKQSKTEGNDAIGAIGEEALNNGKTTSCTGPTHCNYIGKLMHFCQKNELFAPKYTRSMNRGPNNHPTFTVTCEVGPIKHDAKSGKAQMAKQLSSQLMLSRLEEMLKTSATSALKVEQFDSKEHVQKVEERLGAIGFEQLRNPNKNSFAYIERIHDSVKEGANENHKLLKSLVDRCIDSIEDPEALFLQIMEEVNGTWHFSPVESTSPKIVIIGLQMMLFNQLWTFLETGDSSERVKTALYTEALQFLKEMVQ